MKSIVDNKNERGFIMGVGMRGNKIVRAAAGSLAVVMVSFLFNSPSAQQIGNTVGNFIFRGNPELLNGKTINVTDTMVAMSQWFWSQSLRDTTIQNTTTPSIIFVIDNSGSMWGYGQTATDPNALRFSVTRSFIDTIFQKFPHAKVGLAVFGTHLWFNIKDTSSATKYPFLNRLPLAKCLHQFYHDTLLNRTDTLDAYVPLLQLDSVYANYGNLTGIKLLDTLLVTSTNRTPQNHTDLRYHPSDSAFKFSSNGFCTNITAGFDAVKSAMAADNTPHCSQYVVFLSDGEANRPDYTGNNNPFGRSFYFRDSTANVPTTFTVFFTTGTTVPASIATMTTNISVNGYGAPDSCTSRSASYPSTSGNLMTTLTNNIWSQMIIPNQVMPIQITVNGLTSTTWIGDTAFQFNSMIPLIIGGVTPVNIDLTYNFIKNNVRVGDTIEHLSYNIQTLPHGSSAWSPYRRDSFDIWTWYRDVSFHNAVGAIDTPISVITETMDSVELYFTFDSGTAKYGYNGATGLGLPVYLSNKNAFVNGNDAEIVYLQRVTGNIFSAKFKRQVSGVATLNDHVLQYHGATDSIVAVFRNQEADKVVLPLDTLRKAIGFTSITMHLSVTDTTITAGDTTHPVQAIVTDALGRTIDPTWVLPRITYTPVTATFRTGDALITNIGQWGRFTGTMADTVNPRQITVTLTEPNGQLINATLQVRVRPAKPAHLWLEATSTPNMYTPNLKERVVFGQTQAADSVFAVLRDRFSNLVGFSTSTQWLSRNPSVVTVTGVAPATPALGEGILTKAGTLDSAWVRARNNNVDTTLKDSVFVVYNNITYDQLMILRDVNGTGTPIQIHVLYDTLPNQVTLYVQGHRSDGLGGNGGWGPVSGNWSLSAGLLNKTTPVPPSSQTSWTFVPTDTGGAGLNQSITVSLPGGPSTSISPVVFVAAFPNAIAIYPYAGTPDVSGNMKWPAAPAVADTMSADSIFSLLSAKLFYNTGSKIIWLSQYENSTTLANQITWSAVGQRDTILVTSPYCFARLIARQSGQYVTVTAHWNALSYSILIYVLPGAISHLVIEASPSVPNLHHDDPLALITMLSNQTTGSGYAVLRDRWGNYVVLSTHAQWSSTDVTCFTAASGNAALGEGIATRVADQCQSIMIALDSVAVPGIKLRDSVPVILNIINHVALHIYDYDPAKDTAITAISLPTDDSLTLYVEGQRSDNAQWEPVTAIWSKDASLDTKTNPPGTSQLWTVIANSAGSGWIKASRNEGAYFITDSVFATFTEGTPDSIALYRNLGDPVVVPAFPATDTVAAESVDSVFAKIFDRNGKWLRRYEDTVSLAQRTISWTLTRVLGQPNTDSLGLRTGRKTTFAPHTAYTLYRVTATFLDSGRTFSASAQIYVKPGPAQHISAEGQLVPPTDYYLLTHDSRQVSIHLGTLDTIYTQLFAVIRDRDGNFVDYSHNPYWVSRDLTVDTATKGISWAQNGQGQIKRGRLGAGQAYNDVWDLTYSSLGRDSVLAILDSLQIVALRITFRDPISGYDTLTIPGNSITLQIGQSTTVYVQGQYSNGQWENVSGNWSYTAEHNTASNTGHSWLFPPSPVDTTHRGVITVTRGNLSTFITVNIITGPPGSLVFYSDSAAPGGSNNPLANPPQFITVTAGNPLKIAALIFDNSLPNHVWLSSYLFNPTTASGISWSAISRTHNNQDVHDMFDGSRTTGAVRYFTSTRAFDTVVVTAYLSATIIDSVIIVVQSAPFNHIVLEKTPNWWDHLNAPDPCDTLNILDNMDNNSVYAILRDQYGNAMPVAPYYPTLISDRSSDSSLVGVVIPLSSDGQLEALRMTGFGIGMIYAWDSHGNGDSCYVNIEKYHYIALRITDQSYTPYADGYVLTINTNQDSTIYVQGLRSDTTNGVVWETVSALWEILPSLQAVLPGSPRTNTLFTLSPTDTGTGWIRVSMGNYDVVKPDTLPLHFIAGPGVRTTITILTPPAQRIAGQPIQYVDSLFNADGRLVETSPLSTSAYHDIIGRGVLRPEPFILVDGVPMHLDTVPWASHSQQFTNGVATGSFTLYYAPLNPGADSLHQISDTLIVNGATLTAQTVPFALLAAPISSIEMDSTQSGGHPVIGPDTLYYNNSNLSQVLIFAIGYDPYHNNLGPVATNWNVIRDDSTNWYIADSLHPIGGTNPQVNIVYSAVNVPRDQDGWIQVTYPSNPAISDRVYLYIHGPFVRLDSAVTADWSGNGLLDHMTLYFNKTVELDPGFTFQGMTITKGGVSFTVDSILNLGHSDKVWVVALHEDNSTGSPQTGWTPVVTIPNLTNVHIDAASVTSLDGAGPVIWTVEEHRTNLLNDRTKDTVIVTFSEPVQQIGPPLAPLSQSGTNPSILFYVWDSTGVVRNTSMLANIIDLRGLLTPTDGSTYSKFLMYNGQDLTEHNYFSIDTEANKYVVDGRGNKPNYNNQHVKVQVIGQPGDLLPEPNPATPYVGYPDNAPGQFHATENPEATQWVNVLNGGHGGALFQFTFQEPGKSSGVVVQCQIKIYDLVGNLVQADFNPDFYDSDAASDQVLQGNGLVTAHVYWNCTNAKGMVVAPGVYRVVAYLHYTDKAGSQSHEAHKFADEKKIAQLGVSR